MQNFNSGLFWFVEGLLFCVLLMGLSAWARVRSLKMQWWKWAAFLTWVLFTGFTIAPLTEEDEEEEDAAA